MLGPIYSRWNKLPRSIWCCGAETARLICKFCFAFVLSHLSDRLEGSGTRGRWMNDKASAVFERQIERIHQLLEREPANVTWNERIPDPDNLKQLRQVDITIDRDGTKVHAECRLHQAPQDVTWIEELIGRRASLGADVMIAVSS